MDFLNNYNGFLITEILKERMPLPDDVKEIAKIFFENKFDLFVVGGAVRDYVMGIEPHDYDLVTDAQPSQVERILRDKYRLGLHGRHFAVVRVYTDETPEGIEVASYRKDISKGRDNKVNQKDPKVEFGHHITIRDDVMRRDLTINALYYDIKRGKIVDTIGGLSDLTKGIVRAVGNARQRFQEDRLRILRTFRFSARNNFKIDEETSNAIKHDNRLNGISDEDDVTQERINEEFLGMLEWCKEHNDNSAWLRYLNLLKKYKILIRMYPDIKLTLKFFKTLNDKIIYTKLFDRNKPTHDLHNKLIFDLRLSGEIADAVTFLLKIKDIFNDNNIHQLFDYDNRDLNIVFLYRNKIDFNISNETISEYGRLEKIDKKYIDAFINYEVTTNAKELMEMGFKGRELGIEIKRIETEKFKELIG